jgi:hypothetical protein
MTTGGSPMSKADDAHRMIDVAVNRFSAQGHIKG